MAVNGRFPASHLRPIPGGMLNREAAAAWNAMNREAKRRAGVTLRPTGPQSSYRSFGQQQFFWRLWKSGRGNRAARPGSSNHGWGRAVDVKTQAMAAFIRRHGRRYGWSWDEGRRVGEWWHFRYVGGYRGADPGVDAALPTLKAGARGKAVRELQEHLTHKGYKLALSGEFDAATTAAVVHYQRRKGLTADGVVGPLTWQHLRSRPPVLRRGATGDSVARLQQALGRAGHAVSVDGDFGPGTEAAVMGFQRASGLDADGVVGPTTRRALRKALAGKQEKAPEPGGAEVDPAPDVTPPGPGADGEVLVVNPPSDAGPRRLSRQGAEFIAAFEGFRADLYNDAAGHCTIGYGHLVHRGRCTGREPGEFRRGITRQRALEILMADAEHASAAVRRAVKVPLNQAQFDALVSFTFNLGAGALGESTLLKRLNQGDYASVPTQLNRFVKAGGRTLAGLVRRRKAEGAMFASGVSAQIVSTEADTLALQRRLAALGFDPGALDGAWGPATEAAVRAFQRAHGLDDDGVVGPLTERALAGASPRRPMPELRVDGPVQPVAHGSAPALIGPSDANIEDSSAIVNEEVAGGQGGELATVPSAVDLLSRIAEHLGSLLVGQPDPSPTATTTEPVVATPTNGVVEEQTLMLRTPLMTGPAVLRLQARLLELGYSPGPVDGIYGEGSAAAVRSFQADRGLDADGTVRAATRRALDEAVAIRPPTDPAVTPSGTPRIVTARSLGLAFANLFGALGAELHVTGHYSAGRRAENAEQGMARAREFHALHRGKGWGGIGYHYLIPDDGTLICARPTLLKGAHTGAHNSGNVGVNMPGTTGDRPTDAQAATYRWLLGHAHTEELPKAHRTDRDLRRARRHGHNQWSGHRSNGCPGRFLELFVDA